MGSSQKIKWIKEGFAPFLDKVQSHHVFDFCLGYVERADDCIISSFALNESFIRRLVKNREKLGNLVVIWDSNMATQNIGKLLFAAKNTNKLLLTNNHSKVLYMANNQKQCIAVSSVNTTGNYRYEAGFITTDVHLVEFYKSKLDELILESKTWTNYLK